MDHNKYPSGKILRIYNFKLTGQSSPIVRDYATQNDVKNLKAKKTYLANVENSG